MTDDRYDRIRRHPEFIRMAEARTRLAWQLFGLSMAIFLVLLVLVAFFPGALATPLGPGRVTTISWPIGAAVIVLPWFLTILYVRRANADSAAMGNIVRKVLA